MTAIANGPGGRGRRGMSGAVRSPRPVLQTFPLSHIGPKRRVPRRRPYGNGVVANLDVYAGWIVDGVFRLVKSTDVDSTIPTWVSAPASAGATGTAGQMAYDSSYLYVCTATNTWRRIAHATW